MSPVIGELIDAGSRHLSKYVRSGRPLSLDNFRYGVLLLKTAALFNPDVVRDVTHSLNRSLGGYSKEYPIIALLLPSVAGWGSDPNAISSGDLAYLDFWLRSPDPEMRIYRANHVLAYYAPAKRGRQLLEMMPGTARERMTETADLLRESLIDEAHRKQEEGYTNAAWVAATYLKVHAGIKYLDGCWTQLSEHQARKLQDFIVFARYKTRCFDGAERRGLHASMSSVENAIIGMQRYNLHAKTYKGP
jgi:hypothetical protein